MVSTLHEATLCVNLDKTSHNHRLIHICKNTQITKMLQKKEANSILSAHQDDNNKIIHLLSAYYTHVDCFKIVV